MKRTPLSPVVAGLLDQMAASGLPPLEELSVEVARELSRSVALDGDPEDVGEIHDIAVDGGAGPVAARVYRPAEPRTSGVLVWFHGGGWVLGDLDSSDPTWRRLANASGCVVVSVDYRLAPEHPFPAAVDDAWAAVRWVAARAADLGVDPDRLAVGGESAGANLAAVVALLARDAGAPVIRHQLLVNPAMDFTFSQPSYQENGEGYFLTLAGMRWFRDHYLGPDGDPTDWRASPLHAPGLAGVAPAHILTAGYDPLRDEGVQYAARLEAAGVDVVHDHFADLIHGFLLMAGVLPTAVDSIERAGKLLHEALS